MSNFLDYEILDNSVESIIWFLAIILMAFLFKRYIAVLIGKSIYGLFRHYTLEQYGKEFQRRVLVPIGFFMLLLVLRISLETLTYPALWKIEVFNHPLEDILRKLISIVMLLTFTWVLLRLVDFIGFVFKARALHTESKMDDQLVPFFKDSLKALIVFISIIALLGGVLGFNVTSLLAGLGIGGLAIAFAAQESIKDLFGSLTVFLDKPFIVGDVIKVGDVSGTVEKVGIRSTRIRTGDLSLVTLPNKKILDTNVDNMNRRSHRRESLMIGLTYETKQETLIKIISDLRNYFADNDDLNHADTVVIFNSFGESSLNVLIVYFIPFIPVKDHQMRKEEVNFKIMEIVETNGSSFAFPVRSIKLDSEILQKMKEQQPG